MTKCRASPRSRPRSAAPAPADVRCKRAVEDAAAPAGRYRMSTAAGDALSWQGRDLTSRANYFRKRPRPRIAAMVAQSRASRRRQRFRRRGVAARQPIKADEPRYNILYRDDKIYPYICMSGDATRSFAFIAARSIAHRYFGPFPAQARTEGIAILQEGVQLRTCDDTVFANRSRRKCYTRSRCSAPCVRSSASRLRRRCAAAVQFLQGKPRGSRPSLVADGRGSAKLEFEKARIRDKISRRPLQSRSSSKATRVTSTSWPPDGGRARRVECRVIRGGRHVGDRTFLPRHAEGVSLADAVCAFLDTLRRAAVPPTSRSGTLDTDTLAEVLSLQVVARCRSMTIGGERRVWLTMAVENASSRSATLAPEGDAGDRLAALQARCVCRRRCSASNASTCRTRWASARSHHASYSTACRCRAASIAFNVSPASPATTMLRCAKRCRVASRASSPVSTRAGPARHRWWQGTVGSLPMCSLSRGCIKRLIASRKARPASPVSRRSSSRSRRALVLPRITRSASAAASARRRPSVRDPGHRARRAKRGRRVASGNRRHR